MAARLIPSPGEERVPHRGRLQDDLPDVPGTCAGSFRLPRGYACPTGLEE